MGNSITHLMSIDTMREEREWSGDHMRLRLLAEIFVSSLERKRKDMELRELKRQLERENIYLRGEMKTIYPHSDMIGRSDGLRKVLLQIEQVAPTDSTVLILGETGTGKELVAQSIHRLSKRKHRAMIKVNCASLPAALVESELFGRERGAYTGALSKQIGRFEIANGSTIFLDEIAELTTELQAKLLMVLQDGRFERLGSPYTVKVDVRVIAATNRDLSEAVRKGTFREDLFYRLNVFPIHVPPLRERLEDISLLVMAFLKEYSKKMGKKIETMDRRMLEALQRYGWPGNIRELRNVIEQAVIMSPDDRVRIKIPEASAEIRSLYRNLRDIQYRHIIEVLESTGWRIKGPGGAAEILGVKPSTLYTKMENLNIPTRQEKLGVTRNAKKASPAPGSPCR
jgi:transcriptional regulator with GAF, ATPase, and Fis domain